MFTTEEISLSQLCSLPCVTGTTGRISPQRISCAQTTLDQRVGVGDQHRQRHHQCNVLLFIKHRPKHRGAIFLKIIVQNIASLSKKCDIFTGCLGFRKATQKQRQTSMASFLLKIRSRTPLSQKCASLCSYSWAWEEECFV